MADKNEVVGALFPAMINGQKRLAFAITEKHSGSDPSSMKSYAQLEHDSYHVYGKKSWIFNALEADHFVITVKNGSLATKNMLMLLVDKNTPGLTVGDDKPRIGKPSSHIPSFAHHARYHHLFVYQQRFYDKPPHQLQYPA